MALAASLRDALTRLAETLIIGAASGAVLGLAHFPAGSHELQDGDAVAFHVPKPRCLLLMVTAIGAIVFDAGTGAYKSHWGAYRNKLDGSNWLKCRQMSHPRRQAKKSNNRCESNVSYWPCDTSNAGPNGDA
jgi:hypothetical protein